jgi:hypothetical protein
VRQSPRKGLALAGGLALATTAVALVLAGIGTAASGNICTTPTTPTNPYASCVTALVSPHFLTAGKSAVSITAFKNQAGAGGATATHVLLTATFSAPVSVSVIGWSLNGSPLSSSGCNITTVSCSVGNVAGGGKVVMVVEFSTSTNQSVGGNVQYGEGGGNPSGVPNDLQVAKPDNLTIGTGTSAGDCFARSNGGTETGSNNLQLTTVTVPGDPSLNLPCLPIDAGVRDDGFTTQTSFVMFPLLSTGPSTLVIKFTPLPTTLKKNFPLLEDNNGDGIFEITVPACNPQPNPIPTGSDSCIFNRVQLPKGGYELDLYVTGSFLDGSYHG